ncbi:MAG: ATP-binding cassette domain-containing protein, partial [Firmicutes bacterium]|nr:ATP-binding cassette domain-containing protein [Bacillota bacterium]
EALYRPFGTLSGGERVKGLLAALFLREGRYLLIDEPTNHLDAAGRRALGEYLRHKRGFLLVSHDRALLDACTDHTLSINRANIEVVAGNFSAWWEQKQRQDAFEQARSERLGKEITRLKQAAKRTQEWSEQAERRKIGFDPTEVEKSLTRRPNEAAKSKKMMSRSKTIQERREREIGEKSQLLKNIESADDLKITPLEFHSEKLLEFSHVSLAYGDTPVCGDITFTLRQGERLAVTGRNGSGKSTILKAILGDPSVTVTGGLRIPGQLKISCVPQDTSFLRGSLTDYADACGIDESLFKAILRKLDFSRVQFEKDMADFSSGQKKKTLLARSLCEQAHVYLWDEPLNFIDVFSRMQIERLIQAYRPAMLFVEHDAAFCGNIAAGAIAL